jgi:hypothetical protein
MNKKTMKIFNLLSENAQAVALEFQNRKPESEEFWDAIDKEKGIVRKNKKYRFSNRLVDDDELWFAWYPVSTGALGTGDTVWLRYVLKVGRGIYQKLDKVKK